MCLDKITTRKTLKRDKKVWKVVKVVDGEECSYGMWINKHKYVAIGGWFRTNPRKAPIRFLGTVEAEQFELDLAGTETKSRVKYESGFHCFTNPVDAESFKLEKFWLDANIRSYIIPIGTTVLYGQQGGATVVVTPVLRNPRSADDEI